MKSLKVFQSFERVFFSLPLLNIFPEDYLCIYIISIQWDVINIENGEDEDGGRIDFRTKERVSIISLSTVYRVRCILVLLIWLTTMPRVLHEDYLIEFFVLLLIPSIRPLCLPTSYLPSNSSSFPFCLFYTQPWRQINFPKRIKSMFCETSLFPSLKLRVVRAFPKHLIKLLFFFFCSST